MRSLAWARAPSAVGSVREMSMIGPGEVSTERLTEIALKLDQALIDWYHSIADRAVPDEVKATFERLAELEQKEGRELARHVQAFEKD